MADVERLYVSVGAKTENLKSGLDKSRQQLAKFAGAVGAAFGTREIARFAGEAIKLSGIAEGVAGAFERLGKPGLLDELVRATKGTVSQLELMQQAVKANNFKIPLDVLAKGLEFATRRAKETGEEVDYLVRSFVTGIGRKSALVMDNLGISATELQAEVKRVGDFATAVGNIMTREMASSGKSVDTVADKTARLNATFRNTKVAIGGIVTEAIHLKDSLDKVNTVLGSINTILANDEGGGLNLNLRGFRNRVVEANKAVIIARTALLAYEAVADRVNKKAAEIRRGQADQTGQVLPHETPIPTLNAGGLSTMGALPEMREVTINKLKDKLKELNEQIAQTNILDKQAIIILQNKAATIESQIEKIKGLALSTAKLATTGENLLKPMTALPGSFTAITAAIVPLGNALKENSSSWASFKDIAEETIPITEAIQSAFVSMADSISSGLANMITGDTGIEGFFTNILKMVADFAVTFGRLLTAIGIGLSLFSGAGAPFIAAGIILQTVGKIGGNIISQNAGGGGGGMNTGGVRQNINVSGQFRVAGRDLVTVLNRGNESMNATT